MNTIAFLVPAYNEEEVLESTLRALLEVIPADNLYVVDDASQDTTVSIAKRFTTNVISLPSNQGKATAMNIALTYFQLSERYDYIAPMDADTIITPAFVKETSSVFMQDHNKELACVVGKVTGRNYSWVTVYRMWEYEVAQTIHKKAQSIERAILVCPGCATVYRSSIFEKAKIPTGTLAEDMDFTFLIHRNNLGKIAYASNAVVVTQDPNNLSDFLKQIERWYTGFWQCVKKYRVPWGGQTLDVEAALLAVEGLFNAFLVITVAFFVPIALLINPTILLIPLTLDFVFFLLPTLIFTVHKYHTWKIFRYIPHLYLMRILCSLIFMRSFFREMWKLNVLRTWNKTPRYRMKNTIQYYD